MNENTDYADLLNGLPLASFESIVNKRSVLVVAPHPDDESLGCGGLLAWAASTNHRAEIVFLTDGEGSHPNSLKVPPAALGQIRQEEALMAAIHLGIPAGRIHFLSLPDGTLADLATIEFEVATEEIRRLMHVMGPSVVFVTSPLDPHCDHRGAFNIAAAAVGQSDNCILFTYPVWSWLNSEIPFPTPQGVRVDIGPNRQKKTAAIDAHASQHGRVVRDSTSPFVLPESLLQRLDQGYEVYLYA